MRGEALSGEWGAHFGESSLREDLRRFGRRFGSELPKPPGDAPTPRAGRVRGEAVGLRAPQALSGELGAPFESWRVLGEEVKPYGVQPVSLGGARALRGEVGAIERCEPDRGEVSPGDVATE